MERKMSRRGFLASIGALLLGAIIGKHFMPKHKDTDISKLIDQDQVTYGNSVYGGAPKQS